METLRQLFTYLNRKKHQYNKSISILEKFINNDPNKYALLFSKDPNIGIFNKIDEYKHSNFKCIIDYLSQDLKLKQEVRGGSLQNKSTTNFLFDNISDNNSFF